MSTPPLSQATGAEDSKIMIKDVVQRVRCELSDAFDEKVEQPQFIWLAGWTAHVDLSLAINDNAGISPNGSFTDYRKSAVNTDGGLVSNTIKGAPTYGYGLVSQFVSVSAGANLSGQAVRTETVSFTFALDELKAWRMDLERREAGWPPEKKTCVPQSTGLTGNLGLKEWVDSAFYPVQGGSERELSAGIHKADWKQYQIPSIGKKPFDGEHYLDSLLLEQKEMREPLLAQLKTQKAPSVEMRAIRPRSEKECAAQDWTLNATQIDQVADWQRQLKNLQTATNSSASSIASSAEKIRSNIISVATRLEDNKKYVSVMSPSIKARYESARRKMEQINKYVEFCSKYKKIVDGAQAISDRILPSIYQTGTGELQSNWCNPVYYCDKRLSSSPAGMSDTDVDAHDLAMKCKKVDKPQSSTPSLPHGFCRAEACPNASNDTFEALGKNMGIIQASARKAASPKNDPDNVSFETGMLVCANNLTYLTENLSVFVSDIPSQADPPVDSVLHSLQFVISYGANVTPSWTLLQWKGPGQSGNFLSASGVQTHNLQLALGPRTGQASISQDATRLIQNQTVKSLGN